MGLRINGQGRVIICIIFSSVRSQEHSSAISDESESTAEVDGMIFEFEKEPIKLTTLEEETLNTDDSFTIESEGCIIPRLDFLDPSIRKFVNYPSDVSSCWHNKHPLLHTNLTHIWIRTENFQFYNISKEIFYCRYKSFNLIESKIRTVSERLESPVKYQSCIKFKKIVPVNDEFVRVTCYSNQEEIYNNFFAFTPKKPYTQYRENPFEIPKNQPAYNVIIMGVGAVSRLNFHRTMPNTLKLLKEKGAIELLGYNNIANRKFLNLIPILLGMDNADLKRICGWNEFSLVNKCPFIWERFKDSGYYTALVEDTASSTTFNSYSASPTDYYLRPFIQESKRIIRNSTLCMDDKYYFQVMLDYIKSLTSTLQDYKLFGVFWESSISYKYWNSPMLMDHRYEALIKHLDSSNYLNNTILILISDHGTNFGNILNTKQGRLEQRLPFVSILTPPSFNKIYSSAYKNLRKNAGRLTTPFDMHSTLIDLIDLNAIENKELLRSSDSPYAMARGISLFLPIPNNRTCTSAGIDEQWCTCLKSKQMSLQSVKALLASQYLVHELNIILSSYPQCARLRVDEIIEAVELFNSFEKETDWRDVMVTLRTMPGGGLFRATLRRDQNQWSLIGSIGRLNRCDEQNTSCVSDYQLQIYCHCEKIRSL